MNGFTEPNRDNTKFEAALPRRRSAQRRLGGLCVGLPRIVTAIAAAGPGRRTVSRADGATAAGAEAVERLPRRRPRAPCAEHIRAEGKIVETQMDPREHPLLKTSWPTSFAVRTLHRLGVVEQIRPRPMGHPAGAALMMAGTTAKADPAQAQVSRPLAEAPRD